MRTLSDADLRELKRILSDAHACPFTQDRVRALNDLADTALLVKKTSISAIVKGVLSLFGLLLLLGVGYWMQKQLGG
jgi:hypothetical protein